MADTQQDKAARAISRILDIGAAKPMIDIMADALDEVGGGFCTDPDENWALQQRRACRIARRLHEAGYRIARQ